MPALSDLPVPIVLHSLRLAECGPGNSLAAVVWCGLPRVREGERGVTTEWRAVVEREIIFRRSPMRTFPGANAWDPHVPEELAVCNPGHRLTENLWFALHALPSHLRGASGRLSHDRRSRATWKAAV